MKKNVLLQESAIKTYLGLFYYSRILSKGQKQKYSDRTITTRWNNV